MSTPVSVSRLLDAWEAARAQAPAHRVRTLLRAADAAASDDDVAQLPVGEADARLLALRDAAFGPRFDAVARCPRCRESLEMDFRTSDLPAAAAGFDAPGRVDVDGVRVEFREPTVRDLAEATSGRDAAAARSALLARCVTGAWTADGMPVAAPELSAGAVAAVAEALERAAPLSCTRLALRCPACGHEWSSVLDVAAYLWAELDAWARRVLREVHLLARAYGWSEREILALTPARRREYLELIVS